ncbi:hypothetical protein DY000_02042623 [Brassica cretica]|uniref:Uncharacterized protein n=1 Tax=Brassica cretica TaxID=69181 RepID=A0ABQ7BD97_BRACR|nr:hypothetical protein DY000_02042623 [Brassica cretica]
MGEGTLHTEEEPYQENYPNVMEEVLEDVMEAPNEEQYGDGVFQAFEAANEPLYEGCVEENTFTKNRRKTRTRLPRSNQRKSWSLRSDRARTRLGRYVATELSPKLGTRLGR